jgi:hypothetical protein
MLALEQTKTTDSRCEVAGFRHLRANDPRSNSPVRERLAEKAVIRRIGQVIQANALQKALADPENVQFFRLLSELQRFVPHRIRQ